MKYNKTASVTYCCIKPPNTLWLVAIVIITYASACYWGCCSRRILAVQLSCDSSAAQTLLRLSPRFSHGDVKSASKPLKTHGDFSSLSLDLVYWESNCFHIPLTLAIHMDKPNVKRLCSQRAMTSL